MQHFMCDLCQLQTAVQGPAGNLGSATQWRMSVWLVPVTDCSARTSWYPTTRGRLVHLTQETCTKFYDLMNDTKETSVTVCFDMMQNLSLPKTPIRQAYYSTVMWTMLPRNVTGKGRTQDCIFKDTYMAGGLRCKCLHLICTMLHYDLSLPCVVIQLKLCN